MQRTFIRSLAALALAATFSAGAQAAGAYPDKPITFIVPSAAGGSPDVLSRLITTQIAKDTGATMVVENRPGAAGNIGIALVKRAAPDGYTVGYGNINTLAPMVRHPQGAAPCRRASPRRRRCPCRHARPRSVAPRP